MKIRWKNMDNDKRKEFSQKISGSGNGMYGKNHTDSAKEKISKGHKGKQMSDEFKVKMSEVMKKRYENPNERELQRQRVKERYKDLNERLKTSLASKKAWENEGLRKKVSQTLKNLPENKNRQKILCNGIEFDSFSKAIETLNLTSYEIRKRLNSDKYDNWKYIDEHKKLSIETIEKSRKSHMGKKRSIESKNKLSKSLEKFAYEVTYDNNNLFFNSTKELYDYFKNKYNVSNHTMGNIATSNEPWFPKKYIHKCLEGLTIKRINKK